MDYTEQKHVTETLASAWEQFKSVNEESNVQLALKGTVDPLTEAQIFKLNESLTHCQERLVQLEKAWHRPMIAAESKAEQAISPHHSAFQEYLRKGYDQTLHQFEQKTLSAGVAAEGGYLLSQPIIEQVQHNLYTASPLRKLASVERINTEALDMVEEFGSIGSGWTKEMGPVEDTSTPSFARRSIAVHELYAQPKATQKFIDDASIDIDSWLASRLSDSFSQAENKSFIHGDGIGKPRGFLSCKTGKNWGEIEQISSGATGTVTTDALLNLLYSLKETYVARAHFLMNRSTVHLVRSLKDKNSGQYIWSPSLSMGAPSTILGVPVLEVADMPHPSKGSLSIALGDFHAGYQIVDRTDIRILRDPFTEKPFVKFYATKRVGGDIQNYEAIKLLRLDA